MHAQDGKGTLYIVVEGGYLMGVGNINYDDQVTFNNNSSAYRLRVAMGKFLSDRTSVGVGLGLDGYESPSHNTFPVFIEAKRYMSSRYNSLFFLLNTGYSLGLGQEFSKGLHLEPGIGYRMRKRTVDYLISISMNVQRISDGLAIVVDPDSNQFQRVETPIILNSLAFNLAVQF